MLISIADGIGEPFEPDTVHHDMTGICPESTSRSVANILGISPDAIEDLDLVFDDGFERRPVSDFRDNMKFAASLQKRQRLSMFESD